MLFYINDLYEIKLSNSQTPTKLITKKMLIQLKKNTAISSSQNKPPKSQKSSQSNSKATKIKSKTISTLISQRQSPRTPTKPSRYSPQSTTKKGTKKQLFNNSNEKNLCSEAYSSIDI